MAGRRKATGIRPPRWHVVITYKVPEYDPDVVDVEELHELHDVVERGPDWNLIADIRVTLNP